MTEATTSTQRWLDERPRTRRALQITGATTWGALRIAAWTAAFVVIGGVLMTMLFLAMLSIVYGGHHVDAATSDLWVEVWSRALFAVVIVSGVLGLFYGSRRVADDGSPADLRSRAQQSRDLVAQAVVAEALGFSVSQLWLPTLDLGQAQVSWTREVSAPASAESSDLRRAAGMFDMLTVMLANPSVGSSSWMLSSQREEWISRIDRLAAELVVTMAVSGTVFAPASSAGRVSRDGLIVDAAARARGYLAEIPEQHLVPIEEELSKAGTMRGDRFRQLLAEAKAASSSSSSSEPGLQPAG